MSSKVQVVKTDGPAVLVVNGNEVPRDHTVKLETGFVADWLVEAIKVGYEQGFSAGLTAAPATREELLLARWTGALEGVVSKASAASTLPASIRIESMPERVTQHRIERNKQGQIVGNTAVEADA